MGDPAIRKAIVLELFTTTGESIPEDDPIVTGAILFSHKLNEVARLSAEEMQSAGRLAAAAVDEAGRNASLVLTQAGERCASESLAAAARADAAARAAAAQLELQTAERAHLLKAIDAQVSKSVKLANASMSGPAVLRYVPAWYAVVGALIGAVALAAAWKIGIDQGTARSEEAAVGRAFSRVVPSLDPKLREHLMELLRKRAG